MKNVIINFILIFIISYLQLFSQWEPVNKGIWSDKIFKIIDKNNVIYAYSANKGLIISYDFGDSWVSKGFVDNQGQCFDCISMIDDTLFLLADSIYYSDDDFVSWKSIQLPMNYGAVSLCKTDNYFLIGYNFNDISGNLFYSSNYGKDWNDKLNNFILSEKSPVYMIFNKNNRNFFSLNGEQDIKGIYYSDNHFESISKVLLDQNHELNIKFSDDKNDLYASTYGKNYYSTDSGSTWNNIDYYLNEVKLTPIYCEYVFQDTLRVIANFIEATIIISTDNGLTWFQRDENLPKAVSSLSIMGDYIFAGTYGYGIYRAKLSDLTEVDDNKPKSNKIEVVPNPFTQTTTIKYSLPTTGKVKLVVYNALGYEAAVLVDGYKDSGGHEAVFDGSLLPSGAYFYVLHSGKEVFSGKLLLVNNK